MGKSAPRNWTIFLTLVLLLAVVSAGNAQQSEESAPYKVQAVLARSIEDLNYLGGDAAMPPMADSVITTDNAYHKALWDKGVAFRLISQAQYTQNIIDAPVAADSQVYLGQRPFEIGMIQLILTTDLRQLHLKQAQLYMGGVWNWVSWGPAGPKSLQLWDLYFYKAYGADRVQIKAGYVSMNLDFVGLFVGGSTATGGQGVYAVLPYEAGMSYFPLTSPGATLRVKGPQKSYLKLGVQRSIDPNGGSAEVARNHTGFRFIPHEDKALLINEVGYLRGASKDAHEAWFRAGYIYNTTPYKNLVTGHSDSGNHCAFALMDYQIRRSNLEQPSHGLYAGASYIAAPDSLDAYSRYGELRLYEEAPLRKRPADLLSIVASRTQYSSPFVNSLRAQGKTAWRASTTATGSYSMRTSVGSYLSFAASYVHGPAITPRVPNALKLLANWTVYF